jgi:hypothetical protein
MTVSALQAVEIARDHIMARGFKLETTSNLSEAVYLSYPGYSDNLRVAAHGCRHSCGVAYSLEFTYKTDQERDADNLFRHEHEIIDDANYAIERFFIEAEKDDE